MKKDRINTTSVREIKHSFKRFLSLLVMSMLGVGVFVGIKMAAPDMMQSLDKYYDDNNVYDIKVLSTLGLTDDDIDEINNLDGVKKAYGAYSKDVLIKTKSEETVIKVIGITDDLNKVEIKKGRKPKNNSEIVVEETMLKRDGLKIGDKVTLLDDETFNNNELTIVGTVKSPLYITNITSSTNRGNTNIGTGKINYYTYVLESNFNIDYYTESYVIVDGAKEKTTNDKEYKKLVKDTLKEIDKIKSTREKERYNEIYNKIDEEIKKNEDAGDKEFNSAKVKLDDAKNKLVDGKLVLDSSKEKLDFGLVELNNSKEQLEESKLILDENKLKLDDAKKQIDEGKNKINEELSKYGFTLDDINKLKETIYNMESAKDIVIDAIPKDIPNYDEIINVIDKIYELNLGDEFRDFIDNPVVNKDDLINSIPLDTPYYDEIINVINIVTDEQIADEIRDYITNPENIDKIIDAISKDTPNYEEIIKAFEFYKENSSKILELIDAIRKINDAEAKYNEGLLLYNDGLSKYNEGYNTYISYYNEYQNGLSGYDNGLRQYNSNLNLYNSKVKEYYESKNMFDLKIIEAKKKLDEIPKAKWFTYTRLDDSGYSSFIDDGESVSNLSKVFPTIFFVVAILISLISMSRMVEDDRMLIGTFKSLGFSNKHIRRKYLLYSGIATISGGILGSLLGFFILPRYIWSIYKILFDVPAFKYDFNPTNVIVGIIIAVICICGTTLLTIRKVVKEKPSDLMRPKAPENGKRVILERIPFIWNHINFSNKITVRNLFRYKKRVFMTVVGILGCTALMLAGFGIRDSIVKIPEKQFEEVFNFDEIVYLTGDVNSDKIDEIFESKYIKNKLETKMDVSMTSDNYEINLFVPENKDSIKNAVKIKDVKTGRPLELINDKVVISDKLAELEDKKVGDKIKLTDSNNNEYKFIISGICENYVGHYIFMNKETYEKNIKHYETNIVYLNIDNVKNEDSLSTALLQNDNVMSVISVNSTINSVDDMLKSLDSVVLILIILSGALSFVVLYNLSYINISERKREIATLKVLGFTDKEVDNYITKETIILTIIGIALGLIFGIVLTNVIIDTVELEMVRFLREIKPSSFIMTSLIVMLFTLIVNKIIHFALKKIDMIESLKSVE